MEQASSTHHGKPTTTLHRLLPPSPDLRQGIWIVDSGNAYAWRANPAVSANRRVHCMIVSFVAAIAGFTVLIVSTNYLDLREAHPTTMSLLLFLLTALVTLLVFRQMRVIDHLFQLDRIPHRAEESFRLAWRSLVLVQCAVFSYIILSVPFSPLSSPTSSSFTSIATAASSVAAAAAAAVAAALPLLFLLFPLLLILLLWFVVRGPERLHEEQGPSLIKTNRPRFTGGPLFQALSVILSCSMLLTNPTGTDIAVIAIVVVLTITSFWFALSSNPPAASSPAEKQEAAPEDLLIDKV